MCWQKHSKALASPPRGELSGRRIPSEPASCLPGGASGYLEVSVPEHAGAEDGLAVADSGDRPSPRPLRVSQHPGAAEARGLERGEETGVSAVSRRSSR